MSVGSLIYRLYYRPKGIVLNILKQGPYNTYLVQKGNSEMKRASANLQLPALKENTPKVSIHMLTGIKYWYQAVFCLYSLQKEATEYAFEFHVYDDGSIDAGLNAQIRKQVPGVIIHSKEEIQANLDRFLPIEKYPYLRARRIVYPHLRKLTDIHTWGSGYKLVLDADMLFWNPPTEMLEWLKKPETPFYIPDAENSYGYSTSLMEKLAGFPIPEKLNVGIIGLKTEEIDWEKLELWGKTLEYTEGSHYLQEQGLTAMLVSGRACQVGPANRYIVMPGKEEILHPTGVLHHYVAASKTWYFRKSWRKMLPE